MPESAVSEVNWQSEEFEKKQKKLRSLKDVINFFFEIFMWRCLKWYEKSRKVG